MIAARYHESTKHHFGRFARALGYLDWATQPDPFRRYEGAPLHELPRTALAADVAYAALFTADVPSQPISQHSIGEFLRCSMGLSAWKQYGQTRWALRINPSSGNLHPTEAWVVHDGRVFHYAPREHALEERCTFEASAQTAPAADGDGRDYFLVSLTSIVWREAWKYGERAFRYCQHDAGHAIGALRLAAAMLGWRMQLLPDWSDDQTATVLGLDRDADYEGVEREEPECVAVVGRDPGYEVRDPRRLVEAARAGAWFGRANRLSSSHVEWPLIDDVVVATRYPGPSREHRTDDHRTAEPLIVEPNGSRLLHPGAPAVARAARDIILRRRSALAFDARGVLTRDSFFSMLDRLRPGAPPWDVIDWSPNVHLILFIHRIQDLTPGIYAYLRGPDVLAEWKDAMRPEFLWEPANPRTDAPSNLYLLVPIDAGRIANRLSCDQDIAEDGFVGLAMIARFQETLRQRGEWFYRRLFWECGLIGQVLYLEAEACGGRATGIGCYYDDPVHELLGLSDHSWQSLYHFSMGLPLEDTRLTTEPGYHWEQDQTH